MITVSTKILSSTTVFDIDNNKKCFLKWLLKLLIKNCKTKKKKFNCKNISQYYSFYFIFDQINAALMRDLSQKYLKILQTPNIWTAVYK